MVTIHVDLLWLSKLKQTKHTRKQTQTRSHSSQDDSKNSLGPSLLRLRASKSFQKNNNKLTLVIFT